MENTTELVKKTSKKTTSKKNSNKSKAISTPSKVLDLQVEKNSTITEDSKLIKELDKANATCKKQVTEIETLKAQVKKIEGILKDNEKLLSAEKKAGNSFNLSNQSYKAANTKSKKEIDSLKELNIELMNKVILATNEKEVIKSNLHTEIIENELLKDQLNSINPVQHVENLITSLQGKFGKTIGTSIFVVGVITLPTIFTGIGVLVTAIAGGLL
jgi:hypothetical protein